MKNISDVIDHFNENEIVFKLVLATDENIELIKKAKEYHFKKEFKKLKVYN